MIENIEMEKGSDIIYPVFRESIKSGLVVVFINLTEGFAVVSDVNWSKGEYDTQWVEADDMTNWKEYTPKDKFKGIQYD